MVKEYMQLYQNALLPQDTKAGEDNLAGETQKEDVTKIGEMN